MRGWIGFGLGLHNPNTTYNFILYYSCSMHKNIIKKNSTGALALRGLITGKFMLPALDRSGKNDYNIWISNCYTSVEFVYVLGVAWWCAIDASAPELSVTAHPPIAEGIAGNATKVIPC